MGRRAVRWGHFLVACGWRVLLALPAGCAGSAAMQAAPSPEAMIDITQTAFEPSPKVLFFPGQAMFDYDNDDDLDVFVSNTVAIAKMFYANDGQGRFSYAGVEAGLTLVDCSIVTAGVGDFDNDGWLDLVLGRQAGFFGGEDLVVDNRLMLMKNLGPDAQGVVRFRDVSAEAGVDAVTFAMSIGVGDVDNDGLLDLYIGRYNLQDVTFEHISYLPDTPNVLLRNTGVVDGVPRFEDITAAAGVAGTLAAGLAPDTDHILFHVPTWAVMFTDVNEDGLLDLFSVQEVPGGIDLFINNGDLTFTPSQQDLLNRHGGWMGVAQGDFDRDGHIDYFVTNVGADALPVFNPYHISGSWALDNGTPFHRLLKNDGRGRLVDVAAEIEVVPSEVLPPRNRLAGRGLAGFEFGFGCAFFDMDNDGWLDLHWIGDITPGPPSVLRPDYHGVGRFLSNNGGTTFTDRTAERGLFHFLPDDPMRYGFNQPGRALAAVDLTGDGFVDVTRTTTKGLDGPEYGFSCLVNPGLEEGHWIVVRLTGTASNRFGIGARVEATTSGQIFVGEVITTTSAFTAVHPQVHFGLGPATTIEMLTVRWPSGAVTELRDVAADRILTVSESSSE